MAYWVIFEQILAILHLSKKGVIQKNLDGYKHGMPVFTHKKGGGSLLHVERPFLSAKFWTVLHLSKRVVVV